MVKVLLGSDISDSVIELNNLIGVEADKGDEYHDVRIIYRDVNGVYFYRYNLSLEQYKELLEKII